jgi:hypothetical protein
MKKYLGIYGLILLLIASFAFAQGPGTGPGWIDSSGAIFSPSVVNPGHKHSESWASDGSPLVRSTDQIGNVFYGPVDITASASTSATITLIGSTQGELVLGSAQTITTKITTPSTLALKISKGAVQTFNTSGVAIAGLSRAAACVVTWAGHGLANGDTITISGITQAEWTALNGTQAITYINSSTFSISINTSAYALAYDPVTDPGVYAYNFTINGPFEAGLYQVFSCTGTGAVSFGGSSVNKVYPQWFGATGTGTVATDEGPAFRAAANAAKIMGISVYIPPGRYYVNSGTIDATYSNFKLIGAGASSVSIVYGGTSYFVYGQTPAVANGYFYPEISGFQLEITAAGGGIKFGDSASAFSEDKFYYGLRLSNLKIYDTGGTGTYGIDLTQIMRGDLNHIWIGGGFTRNMNLHHLPETSIKNVRSMSADNYNLYVKYLDSLYPAQDGLRFENVALSDVKSGATALYMEGVAGISLDGIFFEDSAAHGVTAMAHLNSCYSITINNIEFSGLAGDTTCKVFYLENPKNITINSARFSSLNEGPWLAGVGTVDVSYSSQKFQINNDYGGVRVINSSYRINELFSPYIGVQILSSGGKVPLSLNNFNRPITGQTGLYSKQLLGQHGKSLMPETSFILSAWHGVPYEQYNSPCSIIADADSSGGYGISIPTGSYIGLKYLYPQEILLGQYEMVARFKAAAGTPTASLYLLKLDGTPVRWQNMACSTTMGTYAWRINLQGADVDTGCAFTIVCGTTDLILDYIVIRPVYNDVLIGTFTGPTVAAADAASGNRIFYGSAAPLTGTHNIGDICINSAPAVGNPKGWRCTVSGTPGTWVSEGNL